MSLLHWTTCLLLIFGRSEGFTTPVAKLLNGREMPVVGLGTAYLDPVKADIALAAALESGYRHFDTAFSYDTERDIGRALKKWFAQGGKREDLFITTKLPRQGNRPSDVSKYVEMSLNNLGLDYIDMYLIHHPFAFLRTPDYKVAKYDNGTAIVDTTTDHVAIWKEMEKAVKAGRIKSIGVSNFNKTQLLKVWNAAEIKPSNLQIENNVYLQQKELVDFSQKLGIVVTGYSPLGSSAIIHLRRKRETVVLPSLIEHPVVQRIAEKYAKSSAQVVLRYNLQRDLVTIPKSANPKRIKENIDIFDFVLSEDDMSELRELDQHGKYRKFDFLTWTGVERHPEYPFADRLPK